MIATNSKKAAVWPGEAGKPLSTVYLAVQSAVATLFLIGIGWPLIQRSPWADEITLFSNYPLDSIQAFFEPLPFFNQAATPLYSVIWGALGFLNPVEIRLLSAAFILFIGIFLTAYCIRKKHVFPVLIASCAILLFDPSFQMISAMKHYGLELLACLVVLAWYLNKDQSQEFDVKDLLILIVALLFGISTFPLGSIALLLFFAERLLRKYSVSRREVILVVAFLVVSSGYYLLVKEIVFFQISNYPDAYRYEGFIASVKQYLKALTGLLPVSGWPSVLLSALVFALLPFFLVLLDAGKTLSSKRLCIFAVTVFSLYLFLSGFGMYPAKSSRHVIWFAPVLWVLLATAVSFAVCFLRLHFKSTYLSLIPLIALLFISAAPSVRALILQPKGTSNAHENETNNNEAISYLQTLPSAKLRFWIGGEIAFHYYLRFDPELSRFSVREWQPNRSALKVFEDPDTYDRTKTDMLPAARETFADVDAGEQFFIFASHFDKQGGSKPNRARGLHEALAERECDYSTTDFTYAHVYDVRCEK